MTNKKIKNFVAENEIRINKALNKLIWLGALVGPCMAAGIYLNLFHFVTYSTCILVTAVVLMFAVMHTILVKKVPYSKLSKYILLFGVQMAVIILSLNNARISIGYFLVAILSLLFYSRRVFTIMSMICYVSMLGCTYFTSFYWVEQGIVFDQQSYISEISGAFTIEFLFMYFAGISILGVMYSHIENVYSETVIDHSQDTAEYSDVLTGLWNEKYMEKAFDKIIATQNRDGVFLMVDINDFRAFNSKYGISEGDKLIITVGSVLGFTFKDYSNVIISRNNIDNFMILLPDMTDRNELISLIEKIKDNLERTFSSDSHQKEVTPSISAIFCKGHMTQFHEAVFLAGKTINQVKKDGNSYYKIYEE